MSTVIFLALLALLLYALYIVLGGDMSALTHLSGGSSNPLTAVTDSLRALGEGLTKAFSGLFH